MSSRKICVFSSSSDDISADYFNHAEKIIEPFISVSYELVYGGSNLGLMGHTARLFNKHNLSITSIMPEKIFKVVGTPSFIENSFVVDSMHERKLKMRDISDCFMALPGGFGTFEELLEIITLKQLGYLNKPIIIANINGYYDELVIAFEKIFSHKFAKSIYRDLYYVSDDPQHIFKYVEEYIPFDNNNKW